MVSHAVCMSAVTTIVQLPPAPIVPLFLHRNIFGTSKNLIHHKICGASGLREIWGEPPSPNPRPNTSIRKFMKNTCRRPFADQILEQDKDLSSVIGTKPTITFRRSKNLRDQLVHSHLNNKGKPTWLENKTKGCHKCGSCLACPYIEKALAYVGREDKPIYTLEHFMNCKTSGVIYVMTCQCGKRYVGKTKREFRRRILEHVGDVKHKRNTSLARHINETHNGCLEMLKFTAVDRIEPTLRVGDIDRKLLQREAQWIYWLNTRAPNGLNEGFTFSPFL
ncbi:hypothetical protein XELAEV_18044541mg [Xenopus laevis]|uniref:GIY-YIG domain-containing protein n=1 Tax=Xenopus laevis TaxID=8355 RepID=A0A974BYY1_XENLA|nr:hypothetical protein XELAEV_18044541mg [Xenopus laevis]